MQMRRTLSTILVFLVVLTLVLVCGCSSSSETYSSSPNFPPATQPPTTTVSQTETVVTKDFEKMALTINDLPHGWIKEGTPVVTDTKHEAKFIYPSSNAVLLTVSMERYATIDAAKEELNLRKNKVTEVRVDTLKIGNEGFGFQQPAYTSVVFRNRNIIVSVNTNTYPAYSIYTLQPYAKLINERIDE